MYLQPWQIFAGGCVCGAFITLLGIIVFIVSSITHAGVRVEKLDKQEEDKDDEL